jgi:uncharacterized protein DUF6527
VRLAELDPVFLSHGGAGVTNADGEPIPLTLGVGLFCNCPCGNADESHRLYVPFANPIGPGPLTPRRGWHRTGETFETLTLTPSILRLDRGGCGWHGFITDGEVRSV